MDTYSKETYRRLADTAERIVRMRTKRARRACVEAGLDGGLLGIHPHNAMVSKDYGKPWPGINYSKVRLCLRIMRDLPNPNDIVTTWYKRVCGIS